MTSTKKKIYIVIILVCFIASGNVLYFGLKTPTAPPDAGPPVNTVGTGMDPNPTNFPGSGAGSGVARNIYSSPAVFPSDAKFDWSLLESETFQGLRSVPDLTLDPSTVGRPNPFNR